MPTVKVVSFMHAVVGKKDGKVVIKASSVNRFCTEMRKKNVDCELDMHDFRSLVTRFPGEMELTPTQVIVKPTNELKMVLRDISRTDIDRPRFQDIDRYWTKVNHEGK